MDIADLEVEDSTTASVSVLLAQVYILAEKYGLPELKIAFLDKIKKLVDFAQNPSMFLQMSRTIYEKTPDTDSCFRTYFQTEFVYIASSQSFSKALLDLIAEAMTSGGSMARDVYLAHISWMRFSSKVSEAEAIDLRKDLKNTGDWKLSLKGSLKGSWADFD